LLLALSGQSYDGRDKQLTVRPVFSEKDFCCLFTGADAYGLFEQRFEKGKLRVAVEVRGGSVPLKHIGLAWPAARAPREPSVRAFVNGKAAKASIEADHGKLRVTLARQENLREGDTVKLTIR
jgi:hypothetical protein